MSPVVVCSSNANKSFYKCRCRFYKFKFFNCLKKPILKALDIRAKLINNRSNTKGQIRYLCQHSVAMVEWGNSCSLVFMTLWPYPLEKELKKILSFLAAKRLMWPGAQAAFQVNNLGLVCTTALMATRGWSWLQLQQGSWILAVWAQWRQIQGSTQLNCYSNFWPSKTKDVLLFFRFPIILWGLCHPFTVERVARWILRARVNNWRAQGQQQH